MKRRRMISGKDYWGFWAEESRSLENASLVALFFSAAISDLRSLRLLDLKELNESLEAGN